MKKIVFLFLSFILILISSCSLKKSYIVSSSPADDFKKYDSASLAVECLFLDEQSIKNRHGRIINPFVSPDLVFSPQHFVIFELKFTNKDSAPIILDSRKVNFFFGERSYRPMSRLKMEEKIREFAEPGNRQQEERIAKENMLPSILTIQGGGSVKGYYAFFGNIKGKNIASELVLQFQDAVKADAATINFDYIFTLLD